MRRLIALMTGVLGVLAAVWLSGSAASAATLTDCLASQHVCVDSTARGIVSQSQQAQLNQEIGDADIYLVIAPSRSAGYDAAMRQLITDLNGGHSQFVIGFLDSRLRHFGAYNQGVLGTGGAASIATTVVTQHRADGDMFAALRDFVRDVRQQAAAGNSGTPQGAGNGGTSSQGSGAGALIAVGVLVLLALGGYFFLLRPRRARRQRELEQELAAAKDAAQDDLIALNTAITDHQNDVSIQSSSEAVAEQSAALDSYERGTRALDAARRPRDMGAVSRAIAEGRYRLACAEALANGQPKPDRRPMCFFDPRHGMSVADVSWAPPDGGPSRTVAACVDCERIVERGDQPEMRTVQSGAGDRVVYANSGFAPAYWGGFGYGGAMFSGFLLGQMLSGPAFFGGGPWGWGGAAGYGPDFDAGPGSDGDFGGGDFGGGDFGGGDFGGGDFGGGDFGGGGGDFGGGSF